MGLIVLYPKGHKRQFTRKDPKDLTPEERKNVLDRRRYKEATDLARAESILFGLGEARRTVLDSQAPTKR